MTRLPWIAAILLAVAPASHGADTVRIAEIGVKGYYSQDRPTRVEIILLHRSAEPIAVDLRIRAHSFPVPRVERIDTFSQHLQLGSAEQRLISVPVLLQASQGASVEVDELDGRGQVLSHDAMFLEAPLQSHLIGILCAKADICQQVQSQISFSGTSFDQTEKGKYLKFVTIENPPGASWECSPVGTLIVARPPWQMEAQQRDALENFARQGGTLILLDDQAHDPSFLSVYRPAGGGVGPSTLGRGKAFFVQFLTSNVLGGFYAGANLGRFVSDLSSTGRTNDELSWIRRRFSLHFHFPTFLWLLIWLSAYLLIAGVGNFILLRKLDRREWGWITLPCISLLFAAAMYLSSVSSRPRLLRADDVTLNWMDEFSLVAFIERGERVSSNRRQTINFEAGGNVILVGDRNGTGSAMSSDPFSDEAGDAFPRWNVRLNPTTVEFRMLQWSFRDLEFAGLEKLPGTVRRLDPNHLRNETGQNFRQAIYVDRGAVYRFSSVPDGAVLDLSAAEKKPLSKVSHASIFAFMGFPTSVAEVSRDEIAASRAASPDSSENASADSAEARNVGQRPFDLIELIQGWPPDGGHAFDARSGVFFGLADEPHPLMSISGKQFIAQGCSVTIVSYERNP
jgi:hypothetical protein